MKKIEIHTLFVFILLLCSMAGVAQLQPALIFSNGMVLQRQVELPIWGITTGGEKVTVTINGISSSTTAESNGKWKVMFAAMEAGGPFNMEIKSGSSTKNYTDVYIGDVWLASGQSNMELTVSQANDATAQIAAANSQLIREFRIPKSTANEPTDLIPAGSNWKPAIKSYVGNFSAAAYYFAKNLQPEIGVPIGIINNSYGGSRIEAWMSDEMLGFDEEVVLAGGTYIERQPTVLFNKMLKPLIDYPIKGFLWYQGESNADNMEDALEYGSLFKTMITGWRELWGMGDLPFIWVQLPNEGEVSTTPGGWDAWPQLRQNQTRALGLPNTGEAVTIDIGEVDIHPKTKIPVGDRLALIARKQVYNEDLVYQGPRYKSHRLLADGKVSIHFDHIGSGLLAKSSDTNSLAGFALGNSYETLVWATANLQGDSVVVFNESVKSPKIVCYAWQYNPQNLNFYNIENLPAAPFKINVTEPVFSIKTFNSTATSIERGQFVVLTWETYGASTITINGETVDPIAGKRVNPDSTTSYELVISNGTETLTKTITVEVLDPKPTISIRTDVGGVAAPETEITITADANPPKDGNITKVELFVDGTSIASFDKKPFETKWTTPAEVGEYEITGVVTDNQGYAVTSAPIKINVTKLKMLIYEAEAASYTGTGSIKSSTQASGGKYTDLQSGWVLTFDNVEVAESGTYPLSIRYLLNYEGPKAQILLVNGKNMGEITFTAPNATTWSTYNMDVALNKGINKIEFDDSWGWMSFDYIAIAVEDTTSGSEQDGINSLEKKKISMSSYPNPFRKSTNINYTIQEDRTIQLDVFNSQGQKVKTLVNEYKAAGDYSIEFDGRNLEPGMYLLKLSMDSYSKTQKLVLTR
ncbi:MAG: sialate O-acetylesterase [Prolixibacteraceae bacterium]